MRADHEPACVLYFCRAQLQGNRISRTSSLDDLKKLMPPPANVPCKDVDWKAIESLIGVTYPAPFKEFIKVYGALQWFDWLQPLIPFENNSSEQFIGFLNEVFDENFGKDVHDKDGNLLAVPRFGTSGGWLPFMTGSDGDAYAWLTEGPPKDWNVLCVLNRRPTVLPPISIIEMILRWLLDEPPMRAVWGSVSEFQKHSPHRITMLR